MTQEASPSSHSDARCSEDRGGLGLVMGGGGARAAYQVGVLRYLAREIPELEIPYLTGVSAGAINTTHLAAHHGNFAQAVEELSTLWAHLTPDDIFRVGTLPLLWNVLRWGLQLVSGGYGGPPRVRGLVDTQPLRELLQETLYVVDGEITGIRANLVRGRLRAASVSASSYSTGQSVTWVQGRGIREWERPLRRSQNTVLTLEHVMASAALPLFFPAIRLEDGWYGDGGLRLSTPLSPAIHLGADRILAISTRYPRTEAEASRPYVDGYPPPAQVAGVLLNSIFLDLLDQDVYRAERINMLLEHVPEEERGGMRQVELLTMRPSQDLGVLANAYEPQLPGTFRFLTRGLGTRDTESPDALSLVLFQPDYLSRLMEIGEADARERGAELVEFVQGTREDGGGEAGGAP